MSHVNYLSRFETYRLYKYTTELQLQQSVHLHIFFSVFLYFFLKPLSSYPSLRKITFSHRSKSEQSHISLSSFSATFFIYSPFHAKTSLQYLVLRWHMYFELIADTYNMPNILDIEICFILFHILQEICPQHRIV